MRRNDYVSIILMHPYYSKKFNNSTEFILFPSSFGVCLDRNKKWLFYEIDERERVDKKYFDSESEAFRCAFEKYDLKMPTEKIAKPANGKRPRLEIWTPNGNVTVGERFIAARRQGVRYACTWKCKSRTALPVSLKRKKKRSVLKKYKLKKRNPFDTIG